MKNGLVVNTANLMSIVDGGYTSTAERTPKFPIRLSGIGNCPRRLAVELRGAGRREFTPRSLRVFEQGHQRGAALASAFYAGWKDWISLATTFKENRFTLMDELEVWMPTEIVGDKAREIVDKALAWAESHATSLSEQTEGQGDCPFTLQGENERLMIRGRADLVIMDQESDDCWIVDFKTKNSWGFKKLEEEGNGYDYSMQVAAYAMALLDEGKNVRGAWLYYEDHDRRSHKVLPVEYEGVNAARRAVELVLLEWVEGMDATAAPAIYAVAGKFGKKKHVGAVATLPWQCNYCSVGPVAGKCVESFRLEDIRTPGADVPRWEILDRE